MGDNAFPSSRYSYRDQLPECRKNKMLFSGDAKIPFHLAAKEDKKPYWNQDFSTWLNSSSTGVDRPKINTATRRRLFS